MTLKSLATGLKLLPVKNSEIADSMIVKLKGAFGRLVLVGALFISFIAQGQVFQIGTVLNGASPSSSPPWITATFTTLFPGTVSLSLAAHLTTATEFIGEIGLNLRPGISPASLLFTQNSGPSFSSLNQPVAEDSANLPGGGVQAAGLDLVIIWPSGGGQPQRFDGSDVVSLTITGPPSLAPEDFFYYNKLGNLTGPVLIGAHVQGIPATGGATTSAAIIQTIPEPGAAPLVLCGLVTAAWLRHRD